MLSVCACVPFETLEKIGLTKCVAKIVIFEVTLKPLLSSFL